MRGYRSSDPVGVLNKEVVGEMPRHSIYAREEDQEEGSEGAVEGQKE